MLVLLLILLLIALVVRDFTCELYRELPGPRPLPLIGSAAAFIGCDQEQLWEAGASLFSRYGGRVVVKVACEHVLHLCDRDDVATVLSHSRNVTKNTPYHFMRPLLGDGLLTSTGKTWYTRRRLLTPAFHRSVLEQYVVAFRASGRRLADDLARAQGHATAPVDLLPFVSRHTLHTLCCTAMGLGPDCKLAGLAEYEDAIVNLGLLAATRLANVWLHSNMVFHSLPAGRRFRRYAAVARRFADHLIQLKRERREDEGDGAGLMKLLLQAERRGEIDEEALRDEINTFLFAGHETTSAAVTFGLMLLAERDDIQERLYSEYVSLGAAPAPNAVGRLPLLDGVVRELLRLYPSAPVISRQVDHDFHMNGVLVRRGTHVAVHLYQLQRHPQLFPDPHAFRPERFAPSAPAPPPFALAPFSAGPRNCIGQKFAKLELKCMLGEVVRRLRLRAAEPRPPLRADLVLRPARPVRVHLLVR